MLPILLIHGYSSEGKNTKVEEIYGDLPKELRKEFGRGSVVAINLSRWISLSDGIAIDDVSFALERALSSSRYKALLDKGFHAVVHSTGALVIKNWMRLFDRKPSPLANLVHLAGANFGSGLAHVGDGQLSRWGRLIFQQVGRGTKVLDELKFGSNKTLDMHLHFREPGRDLYDDYQVQEFCLVGSQTLPFLRVVPIRYVKEDSSDNTVRTSSCNLNFNHVRVTPKASSVELTAKAIADLHEQRLAGARVERLYDVDLGGLAVGRREVPFSVLYETAHFGGDIGIVDGAKNRRRVVPLVKLALSTAYEPADYAAVAAKFHANTQKTFEKAAKLSWSATEWNPNSQYEGHAQVVFRMRDQYGRGVNDYDINFKSRGQGKHRLEKMIEDDRKNGNSFTFYLRTQEYRKRRAWPWKDLLSDCQALDIEITGNEPQSGEIFYLPVTIQLTRANVPKILQTFRTTIIDVTLQRMPSRKVFEVKRAR